MLCGNNRSHYSSLSVARNRRVARNKRGGRKDEPFLISIAAWAKHVDEHFQVSYSNKNKNKMN